MTKLTKLETLEKAVADTEAAWASTRAANDAAYYALYVADKTAAAADAAANSATQTLADAYDALIKAKQDLNNYLKEQY